MSTTSKLTDSMYERLSAERKSLQRQGRIPDWYLTGSWSMFKNKYLYQASDVREQFARIAKTAAKHLIDIDVATVQQAEEKFFSLIWRGVLSPATPVLSNTGTKRGLPVSCQGSYALDSIEDIYRVKKELALHSKHGFGTSVYLGNIRPRGTPISVGGRAEGVVPVFRGLVQDSQYVSQGNTRRGSIGQYLEIEHSDVDELIDYIVANPEDANVGWNISDAFIEKCDRGNPEAVRRFKRTLAFKMQTGRGYDFFVDRANRLAPQAIKNSGVPIKASNLCVHGDTKILTRKGNIKISDLVGQKVDVWNGYEWSSVDVVKTGSDQKLLEVVTSAGHRLKCTPYHKFYVVESYWSDPVEKRAHELRVGDKLIRTVYPIVKGMGSLENAYANGFFTGDGCYEYSGSSVHNKIYLYGEKRKLSKYFDKIKVNGRGGVQEEFNREYLYVDGLQDKFFVPDASYKIKDRIQWLMGLFDADGCICRNAKSQTLQLASVNKEFMQELQLMLTTLGVASKVRSVRKAGMYELPANDGSGLTKKFNCKEVYRILISGTGLETLQSLGFSPRRLDITSHVPNRNAERFNKVESVDPCRGRHDTFCFTEPKRGLGVFNGILTGQCSEIALPSNELYSFICVLSSVNLIHWDSIKNSDDVFWITVFLDCINSEFIKIGAKIPGLERSVKFARDFAALGMGVCGFHTLLQKKRIPFESLEAMFLNREIFEFLDKESRRASAWLAEKKGCAKWAEGTGMRNSTRMAIAPTKSTALLMGGVSEGINPDPAMTYTQASAGGDLLRVNNEILPLMRERGAYKQSEFEEMNKRGGSIQHVDWLDEHEKLVFRNAFELNMEAHVRMTSQRQRYIDQGQSMNLFHPADEDPRWISHIRRMVFKDEWIKGIYYTYSTREIKAAPRECVACQ